MGLTARLRSRHRPYSSPSTGARTAADVMDAPAPPVPAAVPGFADFFVSVVGPPGLLRGLAGQLPAGWSVSLHAEIGDLTVADLVVLIDPTPGKIAAVHVRQPGAAVLVLVGLGAPSSTVVDLLAAGAEVCVRSTDPALVAAYLIACSRRPVLRREDCDLVP